MVGLLIMIAFSLGAAVMHWLCRNDYSEGFNDGMEFERKRMEKEREKSA